MTAEAIEDLPAICTQTIALAEEFRRYALPLPGRDAWIRKQPRAPLTKQELEDHVHNCMRQDELLHLRKLAGIGSDSAKVLTALNTERPFVKEAFGRLRGNHIAQVTLAAILCGTRVKHPYIPPERQNMYHSEEKCGKEDTFDHLIKRHGLRRRWGTGANSVGLMVKMAIRASREAPGINIPKYAT